MMLYHSMVHTNDKTRKHSFFYFVPKGCLCAKAESCGRKEECIASVHFVHKNIHNFRFRRKSKKKTFESFVFLCFFLLLSVGASSVSFFTKNHQTHYHNVVERVFSANRLRSLLTEQQRIYTAQNTTTAMNVESSIKHFYTCIYAFGSFLLATTKQSNYVKSFNSFFVSSVFVDRAKEFLAGWLLLWLFAYDRKFQKLITNSHGFMFISTFDQILVRMKPKSRRSFILWMHFSGQRKNLFFSAAQHITDESGSLILACSPGPPST